MPADEPRSSFLRRPAADRLWDEEPASDPDEIDETAPPEERYELGETLGEGGMGRVVRAVDRRLGRVVALKFLTRDEPEVRRLFLREARSQARVRHDHVLDVYDSGFLDGEPYIAMRYVEGSTLDEIGPRLGLEERVRLVAQVAEGLHAAHREGLLHRDVKPSNVLVEETSRGLRAWVTDFGLAAEIDDGDPTVAGAVAGSPRYIAPERLVGAAPPDRRSDVFSLGVVLYELLTGRFPHEAAQTVQVLRRVAAEPPVPPRQVSPGLPVELEAVILRCLERDPEARYGSAQAVAADLRRYLNGEVVEAHAAGVAYRLTRFALRHKALTVVVGVALLGLAAASGVVTVFAVKEKAARADAEVRREQAEELLRFALVDLRGELEGLGRLEVLDRVDDAALRYFAAVAPDARSDTELLHRSRMLQGIGQGRLLRGRHAEAAEPLTEALELTRELWRRDRSDDERLATLAQSEFWVGFLHWKDDRPAAARPYFLAYRDRSEELLRRDPGNDAWRRELGYAHTNLGMVLRAEGRFEEALEEFRATLAVEEALVAGASPDDPEPRLELASTHNTLGKVLEQVGRLPEAERHLRRGLELREELARRDPSDVPSRELLGSAHGHLGIHLLLRGEAVAAREHFVRMRDLTLALVAHDPEQTDWRYQLAWSHLWLARAALALGEPEAAEEPLRLHREAVDGLLEVDPEHPAWRRTRAEGLLVWDEARWMGRGESAPKAVGEAVATLRALVDERPGDFHATRLLGWATVRAGNGPEAVQILEPLVRDSRDARRLAPWREALACAGRSREAEAVAGRMRSLGWGVPPTSTICSSMSSVGSFRR